MAQAATQAPRPSSERNSPSDARNVSGTRELQRAPDAATQRRAETIFGETAGLRPSLVDSKKGPYDPSNWDKASAEQLRLARKYIAIVSNRNTRVHRATPKNQNNPIEARTWNESLDAASDAVNDAELDPRITQFFFRQEERGKQVPSWPGYRRYMSFGPFHNVGGGDTPRGSKAYIEFWGKP
jgi:hypothetical protein